MVEGPKSCGLTNSKWMPLPFPTNWGSLLYRKSHFQHRKVQDLGQMSDTRTHRAVLDLTVSVKSLEVISPLMAIPATLGSPSPCQRQSLSAPRLPSVLQILVMLTLRQDASMFFSLSVTWLVWWKAIQNEIQTIFKKAIGHQKGDVDKEHWDAVRKDSSLPDCDHGNTLIQSPVMLQPALSNHSYLIYF